MPSRIRTAVSKFIIKNSSTSMCFTILYYLSKKKILHQHVLQSPLGVCFVVHWNIKNYYVSLLKLEIKIMLLIRNIKEIHRRDELRKWRRRLESWKRTPDGKQPLVFTFLHSTRLETWRWRYQQMVHSYFQTSTSAYIVTLNCPLA